MNSDLEKCIVEYLYSLDIQLRNVRRLRRIMINEPMLSLAEEGVRKRIRLYESFLDKPVPRKRRIDIRRTWKGIKYTLRFYRLLLRRKKNENHRLASLRTDIGKSDR